MRTNIMSQQGMKKLMPISSPKKNITLSSVKTKAPTPFEMVGGGIRRFGRLIKSGINKVGTVVADDLFGSKATDDKNRAAGAALNKSYSGRGRSTSNGSMR